MFSKFSFGESGVHVKSVFLVRSIDDVKKLHDLGLYGVIFGKAFYEGNISLDDIDSFQSVNA